MAAKKSANRSKRKANLTAPPIMAGGIATRKQAAVFLGVSLAKLDRLLAAGEIESNRLGYNVAIKADSLFAYRDAVFRGEKRPQPAA